MSAQLLTYIFVGLTFALYIAIAIWSRSASTKEFYVAGGHVHPVANGAATAADWMSAASYLSMAGIIAFEGADGARYLMGWTGGYVLLALCMAPYLRKFAKFTVPDFVGDRYYSQAARVVAILCVVFISFTYIAGQMRGVGIVFSRFLEVDIDLGVMIGMGIVFFYAVLGGMKGITYTQVAQYCVLIFAYLVPAIYISLLLTDVPLPMFGFGSTVNDGSGMFLLDKVDGLSQELGLSVFTEGSKSTVDMFFITAALMAGTAGLPHVIVRFFTVPKVRDARISAGYALIFIALLYTTAPAVAAFARLNIIDALDDRAYQTLPDWFSKWEDSGLLAWVDKNEDGRLQYRGGAALEPVKPQYLATRGLSGERELANSPTTNDNEVYIDRDIIVLAHPEIAQLPNWVVALVAAGGLAAALSTAAGLLLVISSAISHDLLRNTLARNLTDRQELRWARVSAAIAIVIAGLFGIYPPGFVAEVVAFAFGLAAASFFPVILLGIFSTRMNREAAIAGMLSGLIFTASYIIFFKFIAPELNAPDHWWFGISPEGVGTLGMLLNFVVSLLVMQVTPPPPQEIQDMVRNIRVPR
ncbi:MAG: cation acetate symporter [Proteobacteria bacterium]|nr:cation acetate symporter [Pseudomonadota bacterium]MDA0956316.1 cation acetate symporter [Pseudomonadota bacterium]MDA1206865.1 cation acetate symporter [Pseudomonadota bacterium]